MNNNRVKITPDGKVLKMAIGSLLITEAIFTGALMAFTLIAYWFFSSQFIWQGDELLYILSYPFRSNPVLAVGILWFCGSVIVVLVHIWRMARYIQAVVDACDAIVKQNDAVISLPAPLRQVELQLNNLKLESVRNAQAAKDAEQRKNDLIVYLAHDLKTPLTSVIGYLTLLQDEKDISMELRAKYLNISLDKAQRLEELINEFFEITRFSLTHLTLEYESVNLTRMLEQIAYEFNPVFAEKGLSWDLQLEPDVEIVCDPDKLERVFDNLIRNAASYSYSGSTVSLAMTVRDSCVTIRFMNRGKTIPPEKLRRLFEQFYRLDSSRTSSSGGAGLGLAIAKEIVVLHGGTISAESADESVTFTVILPTGHPKSSL